MNDLFYIKNITDTTSDYKNYFKVNCPNKQYLDNMDENISTVKTLDNSVPCFSQIYSGKLYKIDLSVPSIVCNPDDTPSAAYTFRTYKFELKTNTQMYLTRQSQGSSYGIRLY